MLDPYHRWLGIPPGQRPPTFYQLLGIAPDEADPEVIAEAALRQTSHVRTYQTGPHAARCTALLNEIAQAKATLLNPARRRAYDAGLSRARPPGSDATGPAGATVTGLALPPVSGPEAATRNGLPPPPPDSFLPFDVPVEPWTLPESPPRPTRRRRTPLVGWLSGMVFGFVLLVGAALGFALSRPLADPQTEPDLEPEPAPAPTPRTGPPRRGVRLRGHETPVHAVAFFPDGRRALSASGLLLGGQDDPIDCVVRLWDLESGKMHRAFRRHTAPVLALAVSADGQQVLSGGGTLTGMATEKAPVDCTLRLWGVERGTEQARLTGHTAPIQAVAFVPGKDRAISCAADGTVREWDLDGAGELRRLDGLPTPQRLAIAPDGRWALIGCADGSVWRWDLQKGDHFPGNVRAGGAIRSLTFTADGWRGLAVDNREETASERPGRPNLFLLGESRGEPVRRRLSGPAGPVLGAALSADARTIVSGGLDGALLLWEPAAGKGIQRFEEPAHAISSVALSRQGQALLAGTTQGGVWYWSAVPRRVPP
jgi:WD40 repeat protein